MAKTFDAADSRGKANHGWLVSRHSFSFANYYNPARMGFGLLRVLNDDIVAPGRGFGTHPHENMEIVSIPLKGSLRHEDSMGNRHVIGTGEIQLMSAGRGITHAEYNNSEVGEVNFLQIWVFPDKKGSEPRYDQKTIAATTAPNRFHVVAAPLGTAGVVNINQNAWFSMAQIEAGHSLTYRKHRPDNGVYFFLIDGKVSIDTDVLNTRDGLGISEVDNLEVHALLSSTLLCMEVPMQ